MIINIYDCDRTFVSSICDRLPKHEFLDLKNGDRYPSKIGASKNVYAIAAQKRM
jgi:hypothetical protein